MNSLELLGARTHLEELETNLIYSLNLDTGFICIMNSLELSGAKI